MFSLVQIFAVIAALITLEKIVVLVYSLDRKSWQGQKFRFACLTISLALIIGGAAGVVFKLPWGGYALLFGVGGRFCFDRRLIEVNRSRIIKPKRKLLS